MKHVKYIQSSDICGSSVLLFLLKGHNLATFNFLHRKKFILEKLPNTLETEDMRKIR